MEWQTSSQHSGYSGTQMRIKVHNYEKFLGLISEIGSDVGSLNSLVPGWGPAWLRVMFNRDQYVMVLDCDGTDEMLGAKAMLVQDGIEHAIVQSSPSRYWLITDFVKPYKEVIAKMKSIPGIDEKFLRLCAGYRMICTRAVAMPGRVPIFIDDGNLKDPRAINFYETLKKHYDHPVVKRRLRAEIIASNVTDKRMIEAAMDPEFIL